jgi:predicted short-subunit dehydrogenase-like oxidoreductase (DUF2520 family)
MYDTVDALVADSDAIIISVPDGEIAGVWEQIRCLDIKTKIICHCSGAMTSKVFSGVAEAGAYAYSIHPIYAVNSKEESYKTLGEAVFSVEGHERYAGAIRDFIKAFGNDAVVISTENKAKYHLSAVCASNLVTGLYAWASDLLVDCGFDQTMAGKALLPLFTGNAESIKEMGAVNSLTGPVERNDIDTIKKHMAVLADSPYLEVYTGISKRLVEIAKERHADRDYSKMIELLQQ